MATASPILVNSFLCQMTLIGQLDVVSNLPRAFLHSRVAWLVDLFSSEKMMMLTVQCVFLNTGFEGHRCMCTRIFLKWCLVCQLCDYKQSLSVNNIKVREWLHLASNEVIALDYFYYVPW